MWQKKKLGENKLAKTKKTIDTKGLMKITNPDKFMNEVHKEMQEDYKKAIKNKIKQKLKEIAMTQKLLKKQQTELTQMMKGDKEILSEDEYLFGRK